MQHYSRRSSFAEKVLFSKKKKKKERKKRDLTSTSHSFSHCKRCSLRFFSAAAAREAALRAASRFSALLAAASRFCCSIHGNCSASRTKSQILQPCDPGLMDYLTRTPDRVRSGTKTPSRMPNRVRSGTKTPSKHPHKYWGGLDFRGLFIF